MSPIPNRQQMKLHIEPTIKGLQRLLDHARQSGATIGFVPTMGALHEGHLSLIATARAENDLVVSSIFVNPTQFNDAKDLQNYPRTPDADYSILESGGCDVVFTPSVEEMYPDNELIDIDFGLLERVMEGAFRPGHFKGMATVVSRFFNIVSPDRAYFGEKDFQQLAIIRDMNRRQMTGIEIIGCPTLREPDGLAMSSRNIHLSVEERKSAPVIFRALQMAAELLPQKGVAATRAEVIKVIESEASFRVQYLEFVDSATLESIDARHPAKEERACIAVLTSRTRLIDNIAL